MDFVDYLGLYGLFVFVLVALRVLLFDILRRFCLLLYGLCCFGFGCAAGFGGVLAVLFCCEIVCFVIWLFRFGGLFWFVGYWLDCLVLLGYALECYCLVNWQLLVLLMMGFVLLRFMRVV